MSKYDSLLDSLRGFAKRIHALNQRAVREYTPIVEGILRCRSRDCCHIQHTLDHLLDFCGNEPALLLYKKLCRHYWEIDPATTARYVYAYRDLWDSEEPAENECPLCEPEAGDA